MTGVDVEALPPRVAHAVYALMVASRESGMPPTAAEACVYDANWEAFSPAHTAAALREARKWALCATIGGIWVVGETALAQFDAFQARYLRDDEQANGKPFES